MRDLRTERKLDGIEIVYPEKKYFTLYLFRRPRDVPASNVNMPDTISTVLVGVFAQQKMNDVDVDGGRKVRSYR